MIKFLLLSNEKLADLDRELQCRAQPFANALVQLIDLCGSVRAMCKLDLLSVASAHGFGVHSIVAHFAAASFSSSNRRRLSRLISRLPRKWPRPGTRTLLMRPVRINS